MSIINNNPTMAFHMPGGGVNLNVKWDLDISQLLTIDANGAIKGSTTLLSQSDGSVDLVIPEVIDGITVKTLPFRAFEYFKSIKSVTIPKSIEIYAPMAFDMCTSLTSINVDPGNPYFTSIDGVMFSKDHKTVIFYPTGNTKTSYVIPVNVTTIESHSFRNTLFRSIKIPNTVVSIGTNAFCYTDLESIDIPNGVTTLSNSMFLGCNKLISINIDKQKDSIPGAPWGAIKATINWLR